MTDAAQQLDRILHPPHEPFRSGRLEVEAPHVIHFEQCGRADGVPILFVHGGPGAGCSPIDRRFFDPARCHAILVDQRGSGRSTPLGELAGNSIDALIEDFERLRRHLGIERWHLFGGSWGSTLALAYAARHPDRCASLVLRGIWLFRPSDLDWWLYGLRLFKPEAWRAFADHVPFEDRGDLLEAYWRLLTGPDRPRALAAARAWARYEASCCTLLPSDLPAAATGDDAVAWSVARLEAHYCRNERFDADRFLVEGVAALRGIPAVAIHGRYDLVCPVEGADALQRAWPELELEIVADAGHSAREPGIARRLVEACTRIATAGDPRR